MLSIFFYNVNCIDNRFLQVQALYHHPSLGQSIDLTLVRLDLMTNQPRDLPHYDGERGKLLDSFCDYSAHNNPAGDSNPDHWDMGLYVSGWVILSLLKQKYTAPTQTKKTILVCCRLDFFAYENGQRSGVTMGE